MEIQRTRLDPDQELARPWLRTILLSQFQVLTVEGGSISNVTLFAKPDSLRLFEAFKLHLTVDP
jgi:hypothetical protein